MTHREIGKALGVSHAMIQKIERRALKKLRGSVLKDFTGGEPRAMNHYEEMEERGE